MGIQLHHGACTGVGVGWGMGVRVFASGCMQANAFVRANKQPTDPEANALPHL